MNEPKNQLSQTEKSVTPWGARILDVLAGRPRSKLAEEIGLKTGTLNDIISKSMPNAEFAVRIAQALDVSVEWLINGIATPVNSRALEEADAVLLPRFDFGASQHDVDGTSPRQYLVRRKWLERLGTPNTQFWATEMPAPGVDGLAAAGDMLICEFPTEHVQDRQHYIFLVGGVHPIVRLALVSADGIVLHAGDPRAQDIVLPPGAPFGHGENLTCVGHVVAVIQLHLL